MLSSTQQPARAFGCVYVGLLLAIALPALASAQGTREDYERARRFLPDNAGSLVLNADVDVEWIGESDRFWYRRELPREGEEFLVVDAATGDRRPAFDHARLAATLTELIGEAQTATSLPFNSFEFEDGGDAITFSVEDEDWRCSLLDYTCEKRDEEIISGRSPDGRWIAFVRDHDLHVRSAENGAEIRLTEDGTAERAYATRVPSPTLMIRQQTQQPEQNPAVFWSPDSRRLVAPRIDTRGAGTLSMVVHAPEERIRPFHYTYWYPLPPDSVLPSAELYVFDIDARASVRVALPPASLQYYGGPGVSWSDDGSQFYVRVTDRGYTERRLHAVDPATGTARLLIEEQGDPFVNTAAGVDNRHIFDGRQVLWASERDGWMHLYLYEAGNTEPIRQLTSGEWVVRDIAHVDEDAETVYFTAGGREDGRDPYLQHLYRIGLNGSGMRLLTPEDAEHTISFSPSGRYFVDSWSRPDTPPVTAVRRANDGSIAFEVERADISGLEALGWIPPEPFQAKARDGDTDIYGIIWRPTTFDSSKVYPVVETIYTGPQGFFVPKNFRAWRNHAQTIAELGFIVVQVDGFGTARRSRAFHAHAWKNLGDSGLEDHIGALRQIAQRYPYMDLSRVGIYGHSAGGYDAAHALLTHPEFYKVGVASAGNHDHRLDKAWWNTQWMGWPVGAHYEEQSNVTLAENLQGRLLLAHGDVDENVPVSATLRLADALIRADKDFDLIIMTNQNHGFGNHPYFVRRRWDYFVEHLLGVDPPGDFRVAEPENGNR